MSHVMCFVVRFVSRFFLATYAFLVRASKRARRRDNCTTLSMMQNPKPSDITHLHHRPSSSQSSPRVADGASCSFTMLASACCPRAAVAVSALGSPAGRSVDRVPAVVGRRRGFRGARHSSKIPSRLRSASSDASDSDASPASLAALIDRLRAAAGTKNGTDLDEHAEAKVKAIVRELSARDDSAPDPNTIDLAGTNWDLLYSDSAGNSSGKLGPFVGRVTQRFSDERGSGKYANVVRLGPLTLSLAAVAAPVEKSKKKSDEKNESLRVTFVDLAVDVFGKRALNKPFPPGRAGTWRMAYASDAIRVLYTNQGNVFVLTRSER